MTFVQAYLDPKEGIRREYDGDVLKSITLIGTIEDDAWPQPYRGAFEITGEALASLPTEDPDRQNKILELVGQFVKAKHAELTAIHTSKPRTEMATKDEIAALPSITPEILATIPDPPTPEPTPDVSN